MLTVCLRLAAVWSQSTDEIFRKAYVERTAGSAAAARIFKLAELNRLSVYWNADDSLLARRTKGAAAPRSGKRALDLATCPIQQFASKFRDLLPRQGHDVAEHSYILKELSAIMKLKINRDPMNRVHPQHEVTLAIARINLIVEDFQVLLLCSPPTRPQTCPRTPQPLLGCSLFYCSTPTLHALSRHSLPLGNVRSLIGCDHANQLSTTHEHGGSTW